MADEDTRSRIPVWRILGSLLALLFLVLSVGAQPLAIPNAENEDVPGLFAQRRWSPYVVGVGIGVLSWLTFLFSDKALGISTAYVRTPALLEKVFRGKKVDRRAYFQKYAPKIDWEWMVVAGVVIGAFLSAWSSGDFGWELVPSFWRDRMGASPVVRWLVALTGGIIMGVGARWAGGCTSGHGISGTLQLAVSSWLAALCFFIGGMATAMFLFHVLV